MSNKIIFTKTVKTQFRDYDAGQFFLKLRNRRLNCIDLSFIISGDSRSQVSILETREQYLLIMLKFLNKLLLFFDKCTSGVYNPLSFAYPLIKEGCRSLLIRMKPWVDFQTPLENSTPVMIACQHHWPFDNVLPFKFFPLGHAFESPNQRYTKLIFSSINFEHPRFSLCSFLCLIRGFHEGIPRVL